MMIFVSFQTYDDGRIDVGVHAVGIGIVQARSIKLRKEVGKWKMTLDNRAMERNETNKGEKVNNYIKNDGDLA